MPLSLPPLAEQKAIAVVLSAWDRAIGQTTALIAAKQRLKQGLTQQLLTGKRRFALASAKAWLRVQLGEVAVIDQRPVQWNEDEQYRLASVRRNNLGLFDREPQFGRDIKVKKLLEIREGDFLISHIQAAYGAMALVPAEFDGAKISELYTVLRSRDPAKFDTRYLGVLGQDRHFWHQAYLASNGFFAERLRLNFDPDEFLSQIITIPPSLAEQVRIIECCDTANFEISALAERLETLERQKRGLMQQLLSGKVRVPESLLRKGAAT